MDQLLSLFNNYILVYKLLSGCDHSRHSVAPYYASAEMPRLRACYQIEFKRNVILQTIKLPTCHRLLSLHHPQI